MNFPKREGQNATIEIFGDHHTGHCRLRVIAIEGGARLILIPRHVVELERLRAHASHMTEKTSTGHCRMMSMHGQPSDPSSQAVESNFPEQNGSAY
jgi:hypothetical protein